MCRCGGTAVVSPKALDQPRLVVIDSGILSSHSQPGMRKNCCERTFAVTYDTSLNGGAIEKLTRCEPPRVGNSERLRLSYNHPPVISSVSTRVPSTRSEPSRRK